MATVLQPRSQAALLGKLLTADGNMLYAAAILRQLTDRVTGSSGSHRAGLTKDQMGVIYSYYRSGQPTTKYNAIFKLYHAEYDGYFK
jgi:hypothetical protein